MVKPVKIRNLTIGEGIPKICVPVTGRTKEEIEKQAYRITSARPDLVEWRADYFEQVEDLSRVKETLSTLHDIMGQIPILFTFRTEKEGGVRPLSTEAYVNLNQTVSRWGLADAVDVELLFQEEETAVLIDEIHANGCAVVCSNHHFHDTPPVDEMLSLFGRMEEAGADILKIAVMPAGPGDVLKLLRATCEAGETYSRPLISMAMGGQGVVSRISGEIFGSSVTFAAVEEASAPGQLPLEKMRRALALIHGAL